MNELITQTLEAIDFTTCKAPDGRRELAWAGNRLRAALQCSEHRQRLHAQLNKLAADESNQAVYQRADLQRQMQNMGDSGDVDDALADARSLLREWQCNDR